MNFEQLATAMKMPSEAITALSNLFSKDQEAWTAFCKLVNWTSFHAKEMDPEEAATLLEN